MDSLVEECLHCGLPCAKAARYCCYGCELVAELLRESSETSTALRGRLFAATFFAMNLMAVSLVLWSDDLYGAEAAGAMQGVERLFRWLAALFAAPVVFLLGAPLLKRAKISFSAGRMGAEALVVAGALAAFTVSLVHVFLGDGALYFDAAAATLILYTTGRALEANARSKAMGGLLRSSGDTREVERLAASGRWEFVAADLVVVGDRLRVPVGAAVPVDAKLLSAVGSVDVSIVNGESEPLVLGLGQRLPSGAFPLGAAIEVEALATARASSRAKVEQLAGRTLAARANVERSADRAAAWLVPAVAAIAVATAVYWISSGSFDKALTATVAVLVVACPCSFGIAVPLALRAALARAGEAGVEIADTAAFERLASVKAIVFDKTGTLTERRPSVQEFVTLNGNPEVEILRAVAALEVHTVHPIAGALAAFAAEGRAAVAEAKAVVVEQGLGVQGCVGGKHWQIANARALGQWDDEFADFGIVVLRDGEPVARFRLAATLREGAAEAVGQFLEQGMHVEIASGDDPLVVEALARSLGIEGRGGLDPAAKLHHLEDVSRKFGPAAMVGDGSNDTPALAGASVGIALGRDCDLARALADLRCIDGGPASVVWAYLLSRRALSIVRANLAWAFGYNALCLALAAHGDLAPAAAVAAMLVSSVTVVGNSARLLGHPLPHSREACVASLLEPSKLSSELAT